MSDTVFLMTVQDFILTNNTASHDNHEKILFFPKMSMGLRYKEYAKSSSFIVRFEILLWLSGQEMELSQPPSYEPFQTQQKLP